LSANEKKQIKITAQPGMDPSVCRFIVDRPVYPDRSYNCSGPEAAKGSPLLEALFEIDGVDRAFVADNVIVVAKDGDTEWKVLGKTVGAVIREQIASGKTLINRNESASEKREAAIRSKIEELFEKHLNPGIASHGGFIKLEDVKGSVVYLSMGGGCQGCGSAKATLKMGVERAVFSQVPEVTEVVDVTDHAAGTNPYYDKAPDAK
jgi:Fe-S cluster biogenesis protein NfuA